MNKGQLIEMVASDLDIPKAQAARAVESVIAGIGEGIKQDASVTIVGFGSFTRKQRAARTVRNPATGEPMEIKAQATVGFKPAAALKDSIG